MPKFVFCTQTQSQMHINNVILRDGQRVREIETDYLVIFCVVFEIVLIISNAMNSVNMHAW